MTKIMALYNHKGGVSKTTTTFNLAHALAEHLDARVLMIDGDPQCNLTELALAAVIADLDEALEEGAGSGADADELPGSSLLDALGPRFYGERADVDIESIELLQPDESIEVFLLRGDVALNEAEDYLSSAHSQRLGTEVHQRRNYIAIYDMLSRIGRAEEFDYILVDVGPSAGALTRSIFLACDYFLVPTAPDRFNYQAIGSLATILDRWIREHAPAVKDFKKFKMNVPNGKPVCLGLIVQRYQRYGGEAKPGFRLWLERIPERAGSELFPALVEAEGSEDAIGDAAWGDPCVAQIPDFSSLAPMMLTYGKPVWRLTQKDTGWGGKVWAEGQERMEELQDLFFKLADLVADA